jgi:hypothetical protein
MKTRKTVRPKDQLQISVLKQGTPSKKVLSVSFFTMKDAYRNVEKYQRYLQYFLQYKKQLNGFETRIYTDDRGKDFVLSVAKHDPTVSVYHFNYPPLREEKGHIGTFGTLMRFLPLFEPGLEVVWVSDLDIPAYYLDKRLVLKKADFIYRTYPAYKTNVYGRAYTIVANAMISFQTFPKKLLNAYLHTITHPSGSFLEYVKQQNLENQKGHKPYSKVPYGIDEYFMNTIMYDYIIEKMYKCYIIKDYGYTFIHLKHEKLLTKEEDALYWNYLEKPSPRAFPSLKKLYLEKVSLIEDKYPGVTTSITDSFVKIFHKQGDELIYL